MDDLISRQAAIDALRYAQHRFTVADEAGGMGTVKWSEDVIYFAAAERVLTELPSAQPERKKGNWVGIDDEPCETFECDRCGFVLEDWIQGAFYNFCPNCGADMRGEANERMDIDIT